MFFILHCVRTACFSSATRKITAWRNHFFPRWTRSSVCLCAVRRRGRTGNRSLRARSGEQGDQCPSGKREPWPRKRRAAEAPATTDAAEAAQSGRARREVLFGELHLRLLEQYGPPSVVVNESHQIVHLSESAGRYLHFVAGEPTANIVKVIDPALQIELRAALFRAARSQEAVKTAPQRVEIHGTEEIISLEVRPMRASDQAHGFFLVLFEKRYDAPTVAAAASAHETMVARCRRRDPVLERTTQLHGRAIRIGKRGAESCK